MISGVIFIFGLIIGSFLNVVIARLQTQESVLGARSKCPHCKHAIAWFDNIPLVSFLILKAHCRHCKKNISWQYPLVELLTALSFVWLYRVHGLTFDFISYALFTCFLVVIFVYDARHGLILDAVTVPAAIMAVVLNLLRGAGWFDMALGALLGAGFFLCQYVVSKGRWIGGGDIRLGGLMGIMLGWQMLLVAGFLAYVSGAVVALVLMATGKKTMSSAIPFGTFLTAATFVTLMYGPDLLGWYLRLIRVY